MPKEKYCLKVTNDKIQIMRLVGDKMPAFEFPNTPKFFKKAYLLTTHLCNNFDHVTFAIARRMEELKKPLPPNFLPTSVPVVPFVDDRRK